MAKIKHIAMVTLDPERLAKFYQEVFDMKLPCLTGCGGCSPSHHADRPEPVHPSSG